MSGMRKYLKQAGGDGTLWPFDEVLAKRLDMHVVFSNDPTNPAATVSDDNQVGFVGIAAMLPGAGGEKTQTPTPVELPNADGKVDLEKLNAEAAANAAKDAEAARKNAVTGNGDGNLSDGNGTETTTKVARPDPATFTDKAKLTKELKKFKVTPAANATLKKMQSLLAQAYVDADADAAE